MKKILGVLLSAMFALIPLTASAADERFLFDGDLKASGEYNTTVFEFGNTIQNTANAKGLGFLFGNNINTNGSFEYGFHAGNTIRISGKYERDLFAAGSTIEIAKSAEIGRDVYLAGDKVVISTDIPGTAFVAAREIVLQDAVIGDLRVAAEKLTTTAETKITGTFVYNDDLNIKGEDMTVGHTETYHPLTWSFRWGDSGKIIMMIISFGGSIVLAVVFVLIGKKFFLALQEEAEYLDGMQILMAFGVGALAVVAVPLLATLLIVTLIGLPAGLILLIVFAIALILANTIFAGYVGGKIMKGQNIVLRTCLIVALLWFIGLVPYVGLMLNVVTTLIGFGITIKMILKKES